MLFVHRNERRIVHCRNVCVHFQQKYNPNTHMDTHTHTHSFLKHLFVSGGCVMIP